MKKGPMKLDCIVWLHIRETGAVDADDRKDFCLKCKQKDCEFYPPENLAQEYREQAAKYRERRRASLDRCDTEGFVSQACHDLNARLSDTRATICEAGGFSEFWGLYKDNRRVAAKLIQGKYGATWALCDREGNFSGSFMPAKYGKGTKRSKLARLGFVEKRELAPAWAKLSGSGKGLSGLASVYIEVYRKDGGFPRCAVVV